MPRVGIIEILSLWGSSHNTNTALYVTYGFICLLNVFLANLLYFFNSGGTVIAIEEVFDFRTAFVDKTFFYKNTADCVWIGILESLLLPLIAWQAAKAGRIPDEVKEQSREVSCCSCFRCFYGKYRNYSIASTNTDDKKRPLLADGINSDKESQYTNGFEEVDANTKLEKDNSDQKYLQIKERCERNKSIWLFGLFVVSTACQVYIGMKCISFEFKNERRDGALMGLGVLWINLMVWAIREIVTAKTKEDGELIPALHPHRLHLHSTLAGHWCDTCHQRIAGGRAYRCNLCDFDLCVRCHSKKSTVMLEGQLRGDKGVRQEENITGGKYFNRALALAGTEWFLFLLAMMFLFGNNGLSLLLPNIQGQILDSVVHASYPHFNAVVRSYLIVSVVSGFLGGAQSLCFNIVGRKLANTVRIRLFQGIMVQDVAFFDGNTSGQLTSRISNDVGFMVSPIQTMLGTLVSNSMLLLGGVAMCFYTSWRLSMLAFVTVGPIVHVTQMYASWSQQLNRQIYASLATANGFATEALGNIRTVKSFATELMETAKYVEAIEVALRRGITDAFGGAGMYTINNYLDLGAGVLILWYGGMLAIEGKDGLTAGKLITYQLYWGMLNSAYKGLLDILTSFTRAAAAAQRVFALIDSLPDIDLDKGMPMPSIRGELALEDVTFAYQMRPSHLVLDKVSLSIPAGAVCALVGKSGGGKSTIVSLLLRFYDPHEGRVTLDGMDMRGLRLRDIRKQVGVVQQNTDLFGASIEENIAYGLEPGTWTREDIVLAAKQACAHEFICSFPEGYATRVGERGVRISGGQRQRIAIARVFLRKPQVLLLDEATSALDAESEAQVQAALDNLMGDRTHMTNGHHNGHDTASSDTVSSRDLDETNGLKPAPSIVVKSKPTIILVAHRLSTVINADIIAVVDQGKIVEKGNHEELLKLGGSYARLVEKQLKQRASIVDADRAALEAKGDFDADSEAAASSGKQ